MSCIPVKIASSFTNFKANEWKHWCLVYSLYCLFGILPSEELRIWSLFVQACKLLFQHSVHIEQAIKAHSVLINFISSLEELYGWEACTMNTHLHFHLLLTIIDFRPFYTYWCFSYKHFNAVLSSYATNHHSACLQIMKTFKIHHVPLQACLKT